MSPGKRKARAADPGQNPATAKQQVQQQPNRPDHPRQPVEARSVAYRPGAGRAHWLHLVLVCPFHCGVVHHHRGAAAGGLRRARCGRGDYMVVPVSARRTAVVA